MESRGHRTAPHRLEVEMNKKWIAYGVTSIVGLGVISGGAVAAAAAMDLRTTEGTVLPGGALTGKNGSFLDSPSVQLRVTGSAVTLVSAASPAQLASAASPASPLSTNSPASPPSAQSPASPPSANSPASPPSAKSPASPPSANSPASPNSPASVASAASN